jgi:DNA-binding Lrp family transcriptional regulator
MDLNTKIIECQTKNYLFNNNCVYWDEKREFWNNLKFYVHHTGLIENSPWAENSNPTSYYQNQGLSSLQKKIIQYLHTHFFKNGSPVYLKMTTLANRLKVKRQSIQRAIRRLVKRKILLRFYIFSDNAKKSKDNHEKAILLPNNPLKIKLECRINNLDIKRLPLQGKRLPLLEGRGNHLVSKLQGSLQKFRCIIYYIYSINYYYSQLSTKCFKEKHHTSYDVQSLRNCASHDTFSFSSNERNKDTMKRIPRYKLTATQPETKPLLDKTFVGLNELISSVDYDLFNLPDEKRRNLLDHVGIHTYDFDFNKMFSEKKLNTRHVVAQKRVRSLLSDYLKLFFSNEPLNYESTDYILRYWNNIDNPHFSKHRINHESNTYTRIMILTNYVLKFRCNNDMTKFLAITDRLERFGAQNNWLYNYKGKWKLDDILLSRNRYGLKTYFVEDEDEFTKRLHHYRSKEKDASKRYEEIIIDSFFRDNREKGKEYWNKWHSKFDQDLDMKINKMKSCKRELYKMNLTQSKIIDGYETAPILEQYCDWHLESAKRPDIIRLCNYHDFIQFIHQKMRGEYGLEKFWRPIRT